MRRAPRRFMPSTEIVAHLGDELARVGEKAKAIALAELAETITVQPCRDDEREGPGRGLGHAIFIGSTRIGWWALATEAADAAGRLREAIRKGAP